MWGVVQEAVMAEGFGKKSKCGMFKFGWREQTKALIYCTQANVEVAFVRAQVKLSWCICLGRICLGRWAKGLGRR